MSARPHRRLPKLLDRPWAVGVYLGFASLLGLAWALPVASTVASVTGAYPRGDAEVFDPGGVMLLDVARAALPAGGAIRASWLLTALVAAIVGVAVLAFAIAQLVTPGRSRPVWALARAMRSAPTLVLVALVALLANVVAIVVLWVAGTSIARSVWPLPPPRDLARLAVLILVVLALLFIGVLHDLARVAVVMGPSRTYGALRASWRALRRSPGRVLVGYAWRASLGAAALIGATIMGARIGERTAAAIVGSAFVHQTALALAGWLRLSWLSAAAHVLRPVLAEKPNDPSPSLSPGVPITEREPALLPAATTPAPEFLGPNLPAADPTSNTPHPGSPSAEDPVAPNAEHAVAPNAEHAVAPNAEHPEVDTRLSAAPLPSGTEAVVSPVPPAEGAPDKNPLA